MNKSAWAVLVLIVLVVAGLITWAMYERNHWAEKHNADVHKESPVKDTQNLHVDEPKKAEPAPCEKTKEAEKPKQKPKPGTKQKVKPKAKEKPKAVPLASMPIAVVSKNPMPVAVVSKTAVSTTDVSNEP